MSRPYPVARYERHFFDVFAGDRFGIPVQIFWMIGRRHPGHLVSGGRIRLRVRATGSNETAASLAGIRYGGSRF